MKKLFQTFLLIVVVATLFLTQSVKGQVYLNNFGTTTISGTTYSGTPSPLDANISSSVWSTSAPSFTSFTGSTGQALAINSFVVGSTRTITLTMDLNTCYVANITGISLWRQRSTNGPTAMDVSINGTTIASGVAVPTTGAVVSTSVAPLPLNNLTCPITVVITLSGAATTTGTFRFDDFTLNGTVTAATPPTLTVVNPAAVCSPNTVDITSSSVQTANNGTTTKYYTTNALAVAGATDDVATPMAIATSGTYYIRSQFNQCCYTIQPVTVTVNPTPVIGDDIDDFRCSGASSAIDLSSDVSGTTVTWTAALTSGNAIGFSNSTAPLAVTDVNTLGDIDIAQTLTNNSITTPAIVTYTITPTAGGCPGAPYDVALTIYPALDITFVPTCSNGTTYDINFTISGGSGADYYATYADGLSFIDNFDGTGTITGIPVATTSVTLDIEDGNFCQYSETYTLVAPTQPTLSLTPGCGGGAGTGIITPSFTAGAGGTPTYNPSVLTGLANGDYTVTVTESGSGCTATASATINCSGGTTVTGSADGTDPCFCLTAPTLDANNVVLTDGTFGDEMVITTSGPSNPNLVWEVSVSTATTPIVGANFINNNDGTYHIAITYPAGAGGTAGTWSITATETSGSGLPNITVSGGSLCAYTVGTLADITTPVCSTTPITLTATPTGGTFGGAGTGGTYTPAPTGSAQGPLAYSYTYDAHPAVGSNPACPLTLTADISVPACVATCDAVAAAPTGTITPTTFCRTGGALLGSDAEDATPLTDFNLYDRLYLLVDNATGIIVSNATTTADLIAPDNTTTTPIVYSVYSLVYDIAQGVAITDGTSTITLGNANVIKDTGGDALQASPTVAACMDLSPAASTTVTVNPKPELGDDLDDATCSGASAAIDLYANVSGLPANPWTGLTVTWTAALTSGSATGFNNQTTPVTVDNNPDTFEITDVLINPSTTTPAVVTYTITPTPNANGCSGDTYVVALTVYPTLDIDFAPICSVDGTTYDLNFTISGGSGADYAATYATDGLVSLPFTDNFDGTGTITNIPIATTSVTLEVADGNIGGASSDNCSYTETYTFTPPVLSLVPSCGGGVGTGIITPTFTAGAGGTPTYNPATLTGLANGNYTVTVTESGSGCTATSSATITCAATCDAVAAAPTGSITPSSFCGTGGALTGSTAVDPTIIDFNFYDKIYLLVDATGKIVSNGTSVASLIAPNNTGNVPQVYSVYSLVFDDAQGVVIINSTSTITVGDANVIKDGNGDALQATPTVTACMDLSTAAATTVTVNPVPVIGDDLDDQLCNGASSAIDLFSNVSGTTVTWTVALTSGLASGFSNSTMPLNVSPTGTDDITQTLTNTGTGNAVVTYTITPTANGCSGDPYEVELIVYPALKITFAPTCSVDGTTYDLAFTISGGSGTDYAGTFASAGTLVHTFGSTTGTITGIPVATTSVSLDVIDENSCTYTGIYTFTPPTLSLVPSCVSGTGTITPTFTAGASGTPTYNPATLTGLANGNYTVTVTESGSGCTATSSATINCSPLCPTLTVAAPVAVVTSESTCTSCNLIGGVIDVPATSCPAGSTLQYSTDNGTSWSTTLPTYNQTTAITVLTRCNCDVDNNVSSPTSTVTTAPGTCTPISAGLTNNGPICSGSTATFTATPAGATTYAWSAGGSTTDVTTTAALTADATYTVTVTAANGCSSVASSTVTVNTTTAGLSNNGPICSGSTATFTATPAGATTYAWSAGGSTTNTTTTAALTADATYTVTVTAANGCSSVASSTVTVNSTTAGLTNNGPICSGSTATFTATPAGATTYAWSAGGSTTATTITPTLTANATYTVVVTAANGCASTATSTVTVNATPSFTGTVSCSGVAGTGSVSQTATGGTAPYTYAITGGSFGATLADGNYTVTVTDNNSCSTTSTVLVNCSGALIAVGNADATDPCYCITPPTLDANNVVLTTGTFGDEMIITTSPANSTLVWEVLTTTASTPIVGTNFTNNNDGTYTLNITYPAGAGGSAGSWSITATEKTGTNLPNITVSGGSGCSYVIGSLADVVAPACSAATITLTGTPSGGTWGSVATPAGTYSPTPSTVAQGPFQYTYTYDAHPAVGIHPACPLTLRADITVPACSPTCNPSAGTW